MKEVAIKIKRKDGRDPKETASMWLTVRLDTVVRGREKINMSLRLGT